jgi:hypothetical protein
LSKIYFHTEKMVLLQIYKIQLCFFSCFYSLRFFLRFHICYYTFCLYYLSLSVRLPGLPAEIWSRDLPNTKHECYSIEMLIKFCIIKVPLAKRNIFPAVARCSLFTHVVQTLRKIVENVGLCLIAKRRVRRQRTANAFVNGTCTQDHYSAILSFDAVAIRATVQGY